VPEIWRSEARGGAACNPKEPINFIGLSVM
jgi:hypothetical protein